MARCLFVVEEAATIIGRGVVLFPGLQPKGDERFRVGDPLLLEKPDGSRTMARIDSLELPSPNPKKWVLILIEGLNRDDVPKGTQVWSVDANPS